MMEQISELLSSVGGAVTTILLPVIGVFLFYDSKKRKAAAEARKAEAENITNYAAEWKKCYEEERAVEAELNAKIDQLYKEKNEDRQRMRELAMKNAALEIENLKLTVKRCDVKGCPNRQPPSDY